MSFNATIYNVLIASPSDVEEERRLISEIIHKWNEDNTAHYQAALIPIKWETHSIPEMGNRPQALINEQLVNKCDILIGAFWTRLGTHTGIAESGSAEEIERFRNEGKPVMLYFSSVPVTPESIDLEQYKKLGEYKRSLIQKGLLESYTSLEEFKVKIQRQLTTLIRKIHKSPSDMERVLRTDSKYDANKFMKKMETEWESERDTNASSTANGKHILKKFSDGLVNALIEVERELDSDSVLKIKEIIRACKILQNHQTFLDGGKSFRQFWDMGDSLFLETKNILTEI